MATKEALHLLGGILGASPTSSPFFWHLPIFIQTKEKPCKSPVKHRGAALLLLWAVEGIQRAGRAVWVNTGSWSVIMRRVAPRSLLQGREGGGFYSRHVSGHFHTGYLPPTCVSKDQNVRRKRDVQSKGSRWGFYFRAHQSPDAPVIHSETKEQIRSFGELFSLTDPLLERSTLIFH